MMMKRLLLLLLLFNVSACSFNHGGEESDAATGLFQYDDSYVGNNSAVGNILSKLPGDVAHFSLETNEAPYGMTVHYKHDPEMTEERIEETALYNASFIFALVKNAESVTFDFVTREVTITREVLEEWYGEALNPISSEQALTTIIEDDITDKDKRDQFFAALGE